ncbi:sacsin-like isoform X2 [Oscarella lobularis]|uniref:sacsin-like isoform X2 n=1 Tax=Oscarella lobularis TaxID=121494 RepID=UPI003313A00B
MDVSEWEFCPRGQTLWEQIQVILKKYPHGGQILKELIQNADDAGATEVQFLLDARPDAYGRETLINPELARFQGPALYAQNNAVFKDSDWDSIQTLRRSVKEKDPLKVGRFGIGFNSVYHLTDLPSVVSDKKIAFFDPQKKCFEKGGAGYTFSALAIYPDQFAPYKVFGCSMADSSYEATLFRFPLRNDGDESDLRKNVSPEDIRTTVFEPFKKDSHLVPLFLKFVESIKLFDWRPESESPVEVFSVFISEETRQAVRDARAQINVRVENGEDLVEEAFEALVTCRDEFQVLSNQKWLIAHHISSEDSDILKLSKELHLLPWIGLALPIPPLTPQAQDLGRMFCFLPLPLIDDSNTGLPVHVHGSFSVADNRRSLKWRAADCKTDDEVAWNELLLVHLVAPAYEALISKAIALPLDRGTVYRAWPELSRVKYHWQGVVDNVVRRLLCKDVFWTDCGNGSWISLEEAVVNISSELSPDESVAYEEMMRIGEPVLLLPQNVLVCLDRAKARSIARYEAFDSNFLCSSLKKSPYKYVDLTGKKKLSLLAFALRDENYADLVGLFLLPLNDGSFTSFQLSSSPSQIFIANKNCLVSLFQGMENRFLHLSLPKPLRQKLTSIECCKTLSLMHLRHHHVVSLLKRILLNYWPLQDKAIIPWSDQPSRQWMHDLWRWLRIHKDYNDFLGCFVIPCGNFTSVAKLDGERKVIFADVARHDLDLFDGMSQTVASALSSAGCVVLQDCPDYILSNDELRKYVWTQVEALRCLAHVPVSVSSFQEWTEIQCRDVLSFFYRVIDSDSSFTFEIELALLSVPLFRLYQCGAFTCLQKCSTFVPESLKADHLPLRHSLLSFPNREQSLILDKLSPSSYRKLTFEELFAEVVFSDFEAYQIECKTAIVKYLLENHLSLPEIVRKGLNELTFVPVAGGKIKKPTQLFHPEAPLVSELFGNKPVFPGGLFALSNKYGRLLASAGRFRSPESISGLELLEIAEEAAAGDAEKGSAMLSLFCKMGYSWVSDRFSEQVSPISTVAQLLKWIKWCPVQSTSPTSYPSALPWKAERCTTALPSETVCAIDGRRVSFENLSVLVGSTEFILKGRFALDECLLNLIELGQPSLDSVFKNWLNAIEKYESEKECCNVKFHQMQTNFLSLLPQYWSEACLQEAISRHFSDSDFIWINLNVGFVSRHRLTTSSCYVRSLEPWLFIIFQDFYSHLSSPTIQSALGIKSEFSQSDVLNVLAEMKKYHDKGVASAEEVARDLDIAVGILNWITEDVKVSSKLLDRILVPVQHRAKLQLVPPSADVVYGDAERLDSTTDLTDFIVIHRNISDSTAVKLGVSSCRKFRKRCLDDYAVDPGEVYGQRELLATRLAGIIRDYPWGVEILKELVQNADDAGASLLHIVYDKRYHSTEKVFSEKWKHLQGPALLVYNDRPFSEKDFKGIRNLGVGNKGNDASKIGQFGIGFNAVYHLTDCPSFISDNKDLCVLDPLCMFLPTSSFENPGRRFRLGEDFWENFSDVKDAYYSVFSAERLSGCTLPNSWSLIAHASVC